jgi:hypothetical protein
MRLTTCSLVWVLSTVCAAGTLSCGGNSGPGGALDETEAPTRSTATLTASKTLYLAGEDIPLTFANGPGNSTDWIGVYPASVLPGQQASALWY